MLISEAVSSKIDILEKKFGFRELTLQDKARFKSFDEKMNISDLNFNVLFCWGYLHKHIVKEIHGFICVAFTSINHEVTFYPLFGNYSSTTFNTAIDELLYICDDIEIILKFEYVEQHQLPYYIQHSAFLEYGYDDDYSDYIYNTVDFIAMTGSKHKDKRAQLNYLSSRYDIAYHAICDKNIHECKDVLKHWCNIHCCNDCVFSCEALAINKALDYFSELGLIGGVLYLNGKASSFVIASVSRQNYFLYLFQKNSIRIKGLTEHLYLNFASQHPLNSTINFSEDMGLEGLKAYKRRLCDYTQVRKYFVTY